MINEAFTAIKSDLLIADVLYHGRLLLSSHRPTIVSVFMPALTPLLAPAGFEGGALLPVEMINKVYKATLACLLFFMCLFFFFSLV